MEEFCLDVLKRYWLVSSAFYVCLLQIFTRTEANTHVLSFSEGAVVPCSLSADMSLAEVTAELVKVR